MIYVSSACVKNSYIWESVEQLACEGFKNIELSGGTQRTNKIAEKLLFLKEKYNLNLRCHNYFPPPKEHFVMNLASNSDDIFNQTMNLISEALDFSELLGATKYGFHAGFLTDITVNEIGRRVSGRPMSNRNESINMFSKRLKEIMNSENRLELYIENNVVSHNNYKNFSNQNPFLLTSYKDYVELKRFLNFNLLLDVAHLYVSANTLGLDFNDEFSLLIQESDYIHISDNCGLSDDNCKLKQNSQIHKALSKVSLAHKTFTLEINDDLHGLKESYMMLEELCE